MSTIIEMIRYQNSANCISALATSKESFLPITYEINSGKIYGFVSDFGCGSWGLATCIGGRGYLNASGTLLFNGKAVSPKYLESISSFVPEIPITLLGGANSEITAKECIEKALYLSQIQYTVDNIKKIFHLTDNRFNRPISCVSGEIWLISLAINFSLGKEIYCFPWMNHRTISIAITLSKIGVLDHLKANGKIVIIPSNQIRAIKKISDYSLIFKDKRYIYYKKYH